MSVRTAVRRLVQNGRVFFRSLRNPENRYCNNWAKQHLDKIRVVEVGESLSLAPKIGSEVNAAGRHLGFLGSHARKLFVDNILKRVTNSLAADLRRRAASRLLFGDSAPFFALVGVSLASGTGILTKDDELEGVCWEIRDAVAKLQWNKPRNDEAEESTRTEREPARLKDLVIGPPIAKGCSAVVYAARAKRRTDETRAARHIPLEDDARDLSSFPLAIKMMFNYDAESNATCILRAMYRETVPARKYNRNEEMPDWEVKMAENKRWLPPHANIVAMYNVFPDRIPFLPGSTTMYPDALPARLNPHGSGRNMSLFLLMKRYDVTLKEYVLEHQLNIRESILLLAQLLEGVAHINSHGIAHRDLKSDNILLDISEASDNCPSLVITDFGCCLADKVHGLYLPYNSHDVDKGGNAALMPPEVVNAEPGPFTSINYTKADVWAVGTIAYEIFRMKNPFYSVHPNGDASSLKNHNYRESALPPLPENVPNVVSALVKNLLDRSLRKRLSPEMAATVMQLYLWAPSSWLRANSHVPSSNEILQWLLSLTTKVLCEARNVSIKNPNELYYIDQSDKSDKSDKSDNNDNDRSRVHVDLKNFNRSLSTRSSGRRTMPEYQLIASFLGRVTLGNVRECLKWLQKNHAAAAAAAAAAADT